MSKRSRAARERRPTQNIPSPTSKRVVPAHSLESQADFLLHLQRTIGNAAVNQLLRHGQDGPASVVQRAKGGATKPKPTVDSVKKERAWLTWLAQAGVPLPIARELATLASSTRSILDVAELAQKGTAQGIFATRSAAEIVQLARAQPPFAVDDILRLAGIGGRNVDYLKQLGKLNVPTRTLDDLAALADLSLGLTVAEVGALAGVAGRDVTGDLKPLAALVAPNRGQRSAADLATLADQTLGLSVAEITTLIAIAGRDAATYLRLLAPAVVAGRAGGTTLADLAALAASNLGLTANEVLALAAQQWTAVQFGQMTAAGATAQDIAALAALGRSSADLTALTALTLTVDEMKTVAAVAGRDITYLKGLAPVVVANRGKRAVADLAALADPALALTADEIGALAPIEGRNLAYLKLLAPAVVANRGRRSAADLADLAKVALNLGAGDIVQLTAPPNGLADGYTKDKIVTLVGYIGGITGTQMVEVTTWLAPLAPDATLGLLKTLHADGATGLQTHQTVQAFNGAGLDGTQIKARIQQMRGNLDAAARDITEPKTNAAPAGTKVLSGPMIHSRVAQELAGGGGGLAALMYYPTGIDPTTRVENQLWDDCRTDIFLNHPAPLVRAETADEQKIRQRLALNELMTRPALGLNPDFVQQIFAHDEGRAPRDVLDPAAEDALGAALGAHTVSRHVLDGTGEIPDEDALALRALGFPYYMAHSPAGAFSSSGDAQADIDAALKHRAPRDSANWKQMRHELSLGNTWERDIAGVAATGVVATNVGGFVNIVNLPPYSNPGGFGRRPLHPRDDYMARTNAGGFWQLYIGDGRRYLVGYNGAWVVPYVNKTGFAPGAPLTNFNDAPGGVHVRIIPENVTGGWFVHSGWPIP